MDRRGFVIGAGGLLAAAAAPGRLLAQVPARSPNAAAIWVDAQGGPDVEDKPGGGYQLAPKFVEAIRQRRIDCISFTVGEVGNGPDRFRQAVEPIAFFDKLIADNADLLLKVMRSSDIAAARASGRCALIYNFQDTTALEADLDRVEMFKALGIRVMQLTYNKRNLAGDGCLERSNAGLSDFGRQAIAKIEEQKLLLDLSHAGQRTIAEGIAAATRPPSITHSGCRALNDNPRNVGDAEMRALAEKGGVFGLYLMPFLRSGAQPQREDLIRHIEHAARICGEDHIGIGTDNPWVGYVIDDKAREQQRKFFEDRTKRGIAAPGEGPDIFNLVEGYNDAMRFDRLAADLRARGWTATRVDKLLGGNFVRLFSETWG